MASKHDIVINELDYKVEKLIKLYISSLERNRSLEDRLVELQDELERAQKEKQMINEQLKIARVAEAISSGNGSAEARTRVSQLVREIDKCIALLNN